MAVSVSTVLAILCYLLAVDASRLTLQHGALRNFGLHKRHLKREEQPSRPSTDAYLNNKTQPYWVNGSALPEVKFDIGESYSGLLPIDDSKELFFWFVPSTNPAASNEITIWLNGGPGCSSLLGLFKENGPVVWRTGTYLPVPNTFSWSNLTNMVYIEQPVRFSSNSDKYLADDKSAKVGTGFSQGKPNATSQADVAAQFLPFWRNFVDLFDLQHRKLYITGESYAGMYCPYIAAAMLEQNDTAYFNVSGLMIYDPSIQYGVTSQVAAVPFIDAQPGHFPFNDTYSKFLHNRSDACGYTKYIENALTFPPAGPFIDTPGLNYSSKHPRGEATDDCDAFGAVLNAIFDMNPCFNIYQVGLLCPLLWDVLGFPYSDFYLPMGFKEPYFNRTDVKQALHAPENVNWKICTDKHVFIGDDGDLSPPSGINGGPLQKVIESTNNVIVAHGALDAVLIANGTLITLNNLTWNGMQGFSQPPTEPFFVPYSDDPIPGSQAGAGVFGGFVTERGLTFVAVVLAGHEVPEYTPSAGYRQLEYLLGRISSLDEVTPFTTQPYVQQPNGTLGRGTWWPRQD